MKRKRSGILYGILTAVCFVCGFLMFDRGTEGTKEEMPAVAWIQAQEQADTGEIEREWAAREQAEKAAIEAQQAEQEEKQREEKEKSLDKQELRQRFGTAVIVGDSVAEGFLDYEILEADSIIAKKGLRADTAGKDIEKALALSPAHLFLCLGLNDLEYCQGDSSRFVKEYEKRILEIREIAPELSIYVNGILPVLPEAVEEKEDLAYVDAFNRALKRMCQNLDVVYIDSSDLLTGREEWYQKDRVHLKVMFYPIWLDYMEEMAGL
jgi:hypothetical protein